VVDTSKPPRSRLDVAPVLVPRLPRLPGLRVEGLPARRSRVMVAQLSRVLVARRSRVIVGSALER